MSIFGFGTGGSSGFGSSAIFSLLPWANYRSVGTWLEEWTDSIGNEMDVSWGNFISTAARTNLLDPTYTPGVAGAPYLATTTAAPTGLARGSATMLDLLCAIAGIPTPIDTNLTVAMKQGLAVAAQKAFKRKSVRRYILNMLTQITDGVAVSWSNPPNAVALIIGDGEPSPGYGIWVQATSALAEVIRPWITTSSQAIAGRLFPAWGELGIGFSQFRAGYSAAGEMVMPIGSRINILANEHFSSWSAGVPVSWTKTGAATLTQGSTGSINWEFTTSTAVLDLSAATIGQSSGLSQTATYINNRATQRLQLDYQYTNAQGVGVLAVQITDANRDGTTYYWDATSSTWKTAVTSNIVPVSSSRWRYAIDVVPQTASATAVKMGTASLTVAVSALCDGTATTQTTYTIYRVGLYEKFSLADEEAAPAERTLSLPLIDAAGWSAITRTGGGRPILEPANSDRSTYKVINAAQGTFPYHPALSRRGYRATGTWTNLLKGSNSLNGGDWNFINAVNSGVFIISPTIGETVASALQINATSTAANVNQGSLGVPTNKSYVGGVWVKKLSADGNYTDVKLSLISDSTKSTTFTVTQAQGWKYLPIRATFGVADFNQLQFQVDWGAASNNGQIALASAYVYDVTGKPSVLYPPVCQTAIGASGTVQPVTCAVATNTQGVDVLSPLTLRPVAAVTRGSFGGILVPTFDASSQPNGVIVDLAQAAAQNRVVVRVASSALEIRRWDNTGNQWFASIALTASATPTAGQMTWLRDTAITLRCLWDENITQLSCGNGNASGTKPGSWAPSDNSVAFLNIGCDFNSINQFEGIVTDG